MTNETVVFYTLIFLSVGIVLLFIGLHWHFPKRELIQVTDENETESKAILAENLSAKAHNDDRFAAIYGITGLLSFLTGLTWLIWYHGGFGT